MTCIKRTRTQKATHFRLNPFQRLGKINLRAQSDLNNVDNRQSMQVTVKTFAQTREITGEDNIALHISESSTIETVISQLKTRSDKWALALESSVLTACNQELCDLQTVLSDGDELALFPPVTGG